MNAFWLVAGLCAVGAIQILPIFLAKASRSPRAAVRVPAKLVAFFLLLACFILTSAGLLVSFGMLFGKISDYVTLAGAAVFVAADAWVSYWVVFRRASPR